MILADYVIEVATDGAVAALDNVIIPEYGISHPDDFIVMPDNDVPVADDRAVVAHDALTVHCDKGVVCMCPRLHCGIRCFVAAICIVYVVSVLIHSCDYVFLSDK